MSFAKKCDRCGLLYEPYEPNRYLKDEKNFNGILTANIDECGKYYSLEVLDLCDSCSDQLYNWLKMKL